MTIRQAASLAPMQASIRLGSKPEPKSLEDQVADLRQQVAALTQAMAKIQSELANPSNTVTQPANVLNNTWSKSFWTEDGNIETVMRTHTMDWHELATDAALYGVTVSRVSLQDFFKTTEVSKSD